MSGVARISRINEPNRTLLGLDARARINRFEADGTAAIRVTLSLRSINSTRLLREYHVHTNKVDRHDCSTTGEIFNPEGLKLCRIGDSHTSCASGDLSGRRGGLDGTFVRMQYSDSGLALVGARSIAGRSVVVHDAEANRRLACATIELVDPSVPPIGWADSATPAQTCAYARDAACFDERGWKCDECCTSGSQGGLSCWDATYTWQRCCEPRVSPQAAACKYERDRSCFDEIYQCATVIAPE